MEKYNFLYHFTDIFLSEAVKETILIENWKETKDYDPRYEEYAKYFLLMKKNYISKAFSDQEIISKLNASKNRLVNKFNETFKDIFKKEFIKQGCKEDIANHLIPEGIFFTDKINKDALKTFRELEEKIQMQQGDT
jgi:6-pyruvoyl-tetrahydropterin synthase